MRLLVLFFLLPLSLKAVEKPNVILMMADDMGMGDTSAYQGFTANTDVDQLFTPQMERLAQMGMRFTDAHTPSSRCTATRYGLLTGRYAWRSRLKHWVLFGAQGDPLIEKDRPTLATMLKKQGYATAMVGKWHVGLRYRKANNRPAIGWEDADLTKPLYDGPLDHGFDFVRFTSRSHGTSGPKPSAKTNKKGPGHINGRTITGTTGKGKKLVVKGAEAYVLNDLGRRHSDNAMEFLKAHMADAKSQQTPFFLYYAANSNHTPYTPSSSINGVKVAGASRNKAGKSMGVRYDFIHENDVALGRLLDWLEKTPDPRKPGKKLIENTVVIFTSDNGAEKKLATAVGPFRSNKGSVYEGGHRVPFIISWQEKIKGNQTNDSLISLIDIFATLADMAGADLPDLRQGEKGGEDSTSILNALDGKLLTTRSPLFFNDHSEAKVDRAVMAIRCDSPEIAGKSFTGKWKLFFDARLVRFGKVYPYELYNLVEDQKEKANLINKQKLKPLIQYLSDLALLHRNSGGHRLAALASEMPVRFDWSEKEVAAKFTNTSEKVLLTKQGINMTLKASNSDHKFSVGENGLGIGVDEFINKGESLQISFDQDIIIESVALVAKDQKCGGFYRMGSEEALQIYCTNADVDVEDQSGNLSDLGVLKKGEVLTLDSSPYLETENPGEWALKRLIVRPLLKP